MAYRSLAIAITICAAARSASAEPDFEHAKQLYKAAEEAMDAGHYTEAVDDYGAAYDITRDAVLFYKIGAANQKAGKCAVALTYFGRYLKEARPSEKYQQLTRDRIAECSAATSPPPSNDTPPAPNPSTLEPTPPTPAPPPADPVLPPPAPHHAHGSTSAWLLVGGAIAFATVGAVLAYSAKSSENDITDLYVGLGGVAPTYDATTQKRYNDLVDEGHRYQYLSWASFGIAGGAAIAAAVLFVTGHHDDKEAVIAPTASRSGAGVSATWRF